MAYARMVAPILVGVVWSLAAALLLDAGVGGKHLAEWLSASQYLAPFIGFGLSMVEAVTDPWRKP